MNLFLLTMFFIFIIGTYAGERFFQQRLRRISRAYHDGVFYPGHPEARAVREAFVVPGPRPLSSRVTAEQADEEEAAAQAGREKAIAHPHMLCYTRCCTAGRGTFSFSNGEGSVYFLMSDEQEEDLVYIFEV